MARAAGKHIVALKLGQSEGGREAALAHTGSLAGSIEAFDAVAGEAGVVRADTLDDVVEMTELLAYTGAPSGRNLGAITLSGAFRGLLLDGAEKNGLHFRPLEAATTDKLNAILGVGSLVSKSDRRRLWRADQRRQLHQFDRRHAGRPERRHRAGAGADPARGRLRPRRELRPPAGGLRRHPGEEADRVLRADLARPHRLQPRAARRRAACLVPAGGEQGAARDRGGGAARRDGAAGAQRRRRRAGAYAEQSATRRTAAQARQHGSGRAERIRIRKRCCAPTASRRRRRRWSHRSTTRSPPPDASAIRSCSRRCRETLTHKSDVGAVALNLATPEQLRAAYERMTATLAGETLDGMLVGQFVAAGSSWCSACIATARWA